MKAVKSPTATWPQDIYKVFKQLQIRQVAYVPDAGHTQLIKSCHADKNMKAISLTTEDKVWPCWPVRGWVAIAARC